jgi:precorrin-6B methylase 2
MPSVSAAARAIYETITIRYSVSQERRRQRTIDPKSAPRVGFSPAPYLPEAPIDFATSNLTQIADHFRTDKGSMRHLYTPIYEQYLEHWRSRPELTILEIGVASGASLRMWSAYFPQARVIGLDVNEQCHEVCQDNSHIEIRIADATHSPQLDQFDLIIDDGSHLAGHIAQNYRTHWSSLKPGGFYVIEDLACTHDRSYSIAALAVYRISIFNSGMASRSKFSKLVDSELRALDNGISEWEFCHFYRELCIIKKNPACT